MDLSNPYSIPNYSPSLNPIVFPAANPALYPIYQLGWCTPFGIIALNSGSTWTLSISELIWLSPFLITAFDKLLNLIRAVGDFALISNVFDLRINLSSLVTRFNRSSRVKIFYSSRVTLRFFARISCFRPFIMLCVKLKVLAEGTGWVFNSFIMSLVKSAIESLRGVLSRSRIWL